MKVELTTEMKIKSLQEQITSEFIDYCNVNQIDLVKWYKWKLHLIWQHRKLNRDINERPRNVQSNLPSR
jgi:hypothetical protein